MFLCEERVQQLVLSNARSTRRFMINKFKGSLISCDEINVMLSQANRVHVFTNLTLQEIFWGGRHDQFEERDTIGN